MATGEISLNSSLLSGRMRRFDRHEYARREVPRVTPRGMGDVFTVPLKTPLVTAKVSETLTAPLSQQAKSSVRTVPLVPPTTLRSPQPSKVLARQYAPKPVQTGPHNTRHRLHSSTLLTVVAVLLMVAGSSVAFMGWRTNHKVAAQVRGLAQQRDTQADGVPDEDKPTDAAYGAYSVAPDLPRYVRIPKIGVRAMVQRQGVDKTGALKAPGNIHTAGWYDGSSKPGEGGAVLLDGHVAGPSQHGVFYRLKSLTAGDQIEIERGDGRVFTYKVVKTTSAKTNQLDMASALLPVVDGKPGLNLITCTGNVQGMHYDQRLLVYAVQI